MHRALWPVLIAASAAATAQTGQSEKLSPEGQRWWSDISALASDANEGRLTGSSGYMRAASYVISRFKADGLQPAGTEGYLQPIKFEQQNIDEAASKVGLKGAGGTSSRSRAAKTS